MEAKQFFKDMLRMQPYTTATALRLIACLGLYLSFFAIIVGVLMRFFGGWRYEDLGPIVAVYGLYMLFSSFLFNILAIAAKALVVYIENNDTHKQTEDEQDEVEEEEDDDV